MDEKHNKAILELEKVYSGADQMDSEFDRIEYAFENVCQKTVDLIAFREAMDNARALVHSTLRENGSDVC